MKRIAILGSTGNVGVQTLDVIRSMPDSFNVIALTANTNAALLAKQKAEFGAIYAGLVARQGKSCLTEALSMTVDAAVIATGGIDSLQAVAYCLNNGIDVLLANKEALVCGGEVITKMLAKSTSKLLPIDSEHSAVFQLLNGKKPKKIILTASGGAFYNLQANELKYITPTQASQHPRWNMGQDITLDSNTMFNKTLEVLEAKWLFGLDIDDIEVVVHPQSIVHSLVEFADGSVLAQLAQPDMRLPIQYALTYPERLPSLVKSLDISQLPTLAFQPLDREKFPCATLCYNAKCNEGLLPTVMVAANEACRILFREGKIAFCDFYKLILYVTEAFYPNYCGLDVTFELIDKTYSAAKQYMLELYGIV